jgi:hypothetical protein
MDEMDEETGLVVHRYPACLVPTETCASRRLVTGPEGRTIVAICEECSSKEEPCG